MRLNQVRSLISEYYHLGGVSLVLKGIYTKLESKFTYLDESEGEFIITLNGREYTVIGGESRYRWQRFERGVIMPEVKRAMDDVLSRGDTFVDIGAAMGDTPLYAHSLVGDDGAIHAFEPRRDLFKLLNRHRAVNNLQDLWTYNRAVGEDKGEVAAEQIIGDSAGKVPEEAAGQGPVAVDTLDDFLEREDIAPDLIKIDVDGMEDIVLRGGENALGTYPVLLELHHSGILDNRTETVEFVFESANEITFLGSQGTSTSEYRYGETVDKRAILDNDIIVNLLVR